MYINDSLDLTFGNPAVLAWGWFSFRIKFSHKLKERNQKDQPNPTCGVFFNRSVTTDSQQGKPGTISTDSC